MQLHVIVIEVMYMYTYNIRLVSKVHAEPWLINHEMSLVVMYLNSSLS